VQILGKDAWREFRGDPGVKGMNGSSHLAKIEDSTGKLHSCFVKLLDPSKPALLCEALGWVLAHNSETPTVPFAAITAIPKSKLEKNVELPSWTENYDFCPAWCGEIVEGKSVKQIYTWKFFTGRLACLRHKTTRQIAAFDIWTDNRDRNYGNVIKSKSNEYIAIDHETLLHDLLWLPMGLQYAERSLLKEAKTYLPEKDFDKFLADLVGHAEHYKDALKKSEREIKSVISALYPGNSRLESAVIDHLENRCEKDWITDELGLML